MYFVFCLLPSAGSVRPCLQFIEGKSIRAPEPAAKGLDPKLS